MGTADWSLEHGVVEMSTENYRVGTVGELSGRAGDDMVVPD